MKDTEIRGLLLERYYERRREEMVGLSSEDFGGRLSNEDILLIDQGRAIRRCGELLKQIEPARAHGRI